MPSSKSSATQSIRLANRPPVPIELGQRSDAGADLWWEPELGCSHWLTSHRLDMLASPCKDGGR